MTATDTEINDDTLCIIPARSGSKGIRDKNIRLFNGRPLLHYTIDVALSCPNISKVVVSTDSGTIADIARAGGAEAPFLRPPELARDDSPSIDAIRHGMDFFEKRGECYGYCAVLEPTGPLRLVEDVEKAIRLVKEPDVDTVVGVVDTDLDLSDLMVPVDGHYIRPFIEDKTITIRRQDSTRTVKLNGCVYVIKRSVLRDPRTKIFSPYGDNSHLRTKFVLMPNERSIEIDNMIQFRLAELLMREREGNL